MGLTMAEKILARAAGLESVSPGEVAMAAVDLALSHENADAVCRDFQNRGSIAVWDPARIVIVFDHHVPAESEQSAGIHKRIREFVRRQHIRHFYDVGRGGICHQVLAENGLVRPGMVVAGTDYSTAMHGAFGAYSIEVTSAEMAAVWAEGRMWFAVPATIRVEVGGEWRRWVSTQDLIFHLATLPGAVSPEPYAVEFDGPAVRRLGMGSRMVLAHMARAVGARAAFTPLDGRLRSLLSRHHAPFNHLDLAAGPDPDAAYERVLTVSLDEAVREPLVICPGSTDAARPVSSLEPVQIDQAVIGSCASGRLEDLETAANMLAGRRVHSRVRLLITPASQQVCLEALRLGYLETLVAAGAVINPPGCGPCRGTHQGVLAAGETCVASISRNVAGRMGSTNAAIYLASPAVVAASAVAGRIIHPAEVRP